MRRIPSPFPASSSRLLLAAAALAVAAACGGETPTGSNLGAIEITASTSGEDLDPDGYTVVVDGDESRPLGIDETVTTSDVPPGRYVLELTGVAANCGVEGENPRTIQVSGGETASTTFEVTCDSIPGAMEVSASTRGQDHDSDGYTVLVDSGTEDEKTGDIDGPNGSIIFSGLVAGDHTVELDGSSVANNCRLDDGEENPRTVSVPKDDTASTTFEFTCSDAVGDLVVTAATSGEDQDPDGYEVVIDGTQSDSIGPNDEITFDDMAAGDHEVVLQTSSVAPNCSVEGDNSRAVNVPNGGETTVAFQVECLEALGDLTVGASTSGTDQDGDGYDVTVTDTATNDAVSKSIGPNDSTTFSNLDSQEGGKEYEVELSDIASNCTVIDGSNPRTVTVPIEGTASTSFSVDCNGLPTADLTHSPSNPEVGETVTLDASGSSDADGSIVEYRWDFENDGTVDQTTTSATTTTSYSSSGDVTAAVTVVDDDGATDKATTTVSVVESS